MVGVIGGGDGVVGVVGGGDGVVGVVGEGDGVVGGSDGDDAGSLRGSLRLQGSTSVPQISPHPNLPPWGEPLQYPPEQPPTDKWCANFSRKMARGRLPPPPTPTPSLPPAFVCPADAPFRTQPRHVTFRCQ